MNFKEIKELIGIFSSTVSIDEIEIERSGVRVRMRRSGDHPGPGDARSSEPEVIVSAGAPAETSPAEPSPSAEEAGLVYVASPIVGTFYRAPSPDAEPFVNVGDSVEAGSVLCIVEAMKLMNEIEAEHAGEIASIFVENGHPVEYGERLFAIRHR